MADTSKLVADLRIERDSAGRLIAARLTTPDKILEPVIDKKIRFQAALDSKIFASTAIARTMRGLRVDLDRLIGDVRPALPTRLRGSRGRGAAARARPGLVGPARRHR